MFVLPFTVVANALAPTAPWISAWEAHVAATCEGVTAVTQCCASLIAFLYSVYAEVGLRRAFLIKVWEGTWK
jgi:hypothetical protein